MKIETNLYNIKTGNYTCNRKQQNNKTNFMAVNNVSANNNLSFTGLRIKAIGTDINPFKLLFSDRNTDRLWDKSTHIASRLGVHTRNIFYKIEFLPKNRADFLMDLSDVYNARNFEKEVKEDTKSVFNIFDLVKKPETTHRNILHRTNANFETLEKLFKNAQSKDKVDFVIRVQHDVLDYSEKSANVIIDMLESPHSESYIKETDKYSSYLKLNSEDKNCIKNLDKLVESGKYDPAKYDKELLYRNLMKNSSISKLMSPYGHTIEKNITRSRERFLRHFCNDFLAYRKGLSEEDNIDILKMYSSTSRENLDMRLRLIDRFRYSFSQADTGVSDIRSIKNLFDRMDKDKHAASFVEKALDAGIKIESSEELNNILNIVPAKKADIFYKNIVRIVQFTTKEDRAEVLLTEVENPFFPKKVLNEKIRRSVIIKEPPEDTTWEKFSKYVRNRFNIYKLKKAEQEQPEIYTPGSFENISALPEDFIHTPRIEETITRPAINMPSDGINLLSGISRRATAKPLSTVTAETTPVTAPDKSKIKIPAKSVLKRVLSSAQNAKKLKLESDVNDVISKKLGAKTYEYQKRDYSIKATVMRIKMLPEIFDSISATRKAQRAQGKKHPNVENKDALLLYEQIRGRNRKLIRYMLKQTDENNQRIFNVKEISDFIDNAERKIIKDKISNPAYKAADAKAYYEELFQQMVEEHGKLKRTKKSK